MLRFTVRFALAALALMSSLSMAAPTRPANTAPTLTGSPPATIVQGETYSFTATAADRDGNTVRCYLFNRPDWLSFDTNSCRASGVVPARTAAGTVYSNLLITASDGRGGFAALRPFSITVAASTRGSLTLGGTPATSTTVGANYSFTPTLANTTGKTATFSVANKPAWMSFSTATGTLSGIPGAAQAATYRDIAITASNGSTTTSLASFSLTVTPVAAPPAPASPAKGSAVVSWSPPTSTTAGEALQDLAGYRLYYGNALTDLSKTVAVPDPGQKSYVVTGLGAGTWYFAVTAYTTSGSESQMSNIGSKTIN